MAQMNLSTRQSQTNKHRELSCGRQMGEIRGEKSWEFGISRCQLSYIGLINNKFLLYSTGNCIQYPDKS